VIAENCLDRGKFVFGANVCTLGRMMLAGIPVADKNVLELASAPASRIR